MSSILRKAKDKISKGITYKISCKKKIRNRLHWVDSRMTEQRKERSSQGRNYQLQKLFVGEIPRNTTLLFSSPTLKWIYLLTKFKCLRDSTRCWPWKEWITEPILAIQLWKPTVRLNVDTSDVCIFKHLALAIPVARILKHFIVVW